MKHLAILALFALSSGFATAATAHATLAEKHAVQGETTRFTIRVPHGCAGEATLRLRVRIPEGMIAAQPMVKAGWALETVTEPYETAHDHYGRTLTEGVREIIWSGELPDAYYDEFVFRARVTDTLPANATVYVPVVQECANAAERWIETPAAGQTGDDLEFPAPGVCSGRSCCSSWGLWRWRSATVWFLPRPSHAGPHGPPLRFPARSGPKSGSAC